MTPRAELPFLIVHGAAVWKLLLVVVTVPCAYLTVRRDRRSIPGWLAASGCWAGVWWVVLYLIGAHAMTRMQRDESLAPDLGSLGNPAIAAAMPRSRDHVLTQLSRTFADQRGKRAVGYQLAVARLRGECPWEVLAWADRLDEALFFAKQCGRRQDVAHVLARQGRFAEAAIWLPPNDRSRLAAVIAAATGNWVRLADNFEAEDARPDVAARRRCAAAVFRVWSGDADAFERTPRPLDLEHTCHLYEVFTLPRDQQAAAIVRIGLAGMYEERLCRLAGGCPPRFGVPSAFVAEEVDVLYAPSADDPRAAAAMVAELRGDFRQARSEAEKAQEESREALAKSIAIHEGSTFAIQRELPLVLESALSLRAGGDPPLDHLLFAPRELTTQACRTALLQARDGDGSALLDVLARPPHDWLDLDLLLGVLPRVSIARAEIADELRYRYAGGEVSDSISRQMIGAMNHRDLARLSGDREEAGRWQAVLDRDDQVLRDWHKAVALALL